MTIDKLRVTCQKCEHVFDAEVVTNAPITVTVASMKAVRCPRCGSDKCGLGGSYDDAPPLTAPITDRAQWWRERGEVGISSQTIWSAFTGAGMRDPDTPHDPDDFRRCRLLLALIPEWRADIGRVAMAYPWYKPFTDQWDTFDRMYDEAKAKKYRNRTAEATGWTPLYDLMKLAERESEQIRFPARRARR